jgi:hypothetical protein
MLGLGLGLSRNLDNNSNAVFSDHQKAPDRMELNSCLLA